MHISDYLNAETTTIEFKENLNSPKPVSWLKTVSAFSNTKSGTIIVGVRDSDKEPVGLSENTDSVVEKARTLINTRIEPPASYEIETVKENRKTFIIIYVDKGNYPPYYYSHEDRKIAYIRRGDESVKAPAHMSLSNRD
ncbi:MAG: ATP-binding protein [Methanocorpusculum sp.]|nr:ATP-binding protein [Methanocorpusculum sp.]